MTRGQALIFAIAVALASSAAGRDDDDRIATIVGRTMSNRGEFLANVRVRVTVFPAPDGDSEPVKLETETDASGRYRISVPVDRESTDAQIEFEKPGFQVATSIFDDGGAIIFLALKPGRVKIPYVLERTAGADDGRSTPHQKLTHPVASIEGRVIDQAGEVLNDAIIRVAVPAVDMRDVFPRSGHTTFETRTDAEGRYQIHVPLESGSTASVDAMKAGYGSASGTFQSGGDVRNCSLRPGRTAHASFALWPALYVSGLVVDENGTAISDASLVGIDRHVSSFGYVSRTTSGKNGKFEIFDFSPAPYAVNGNTSKAELIVNHPNYVGHVIADVYQSATDGRASLRVVLPTGHQVSGRVLNVAGRPVGNVMVEAIDRSGRHDKATLTDDRGYYTLRGLSSGDIQIRAHAIHLWQKAVKTVALNKDYKDFEIRLKSIGRSEDLKTVSVLGMKLAELNPQLQEAFDLGISRGVIVVDPGRNPGRLGLDDLLAGDCFIWIDGQAISTVRQFVAAILGAVSAGSDHYNCHVVYLMRRIDGIGTMTQDLSFTNEDVQELEHLFDDKE